MTPKTLVYNLPVSKMIISSTKNTEKTLKLPSNKKIRKKQPNSLKRKLKAKISIRNLSSQRNQNQANSKKLKLSLPKQS